MALSDGLKRKLEELKHSYVEQLPQKVEGIASLWGALQAGQWDWTSLKAVRQATHNITGSSLMHGIDPVTARAIELEEFLDLLLAQKKAVTNDQRSQVNFLLAALKRAVEEL